MNARPLLDILIEHVSLPMPEGCDTWSMRSVRPDLSSSHGFRWPQPGQWAQAPGPILDHRESCPQAVGDGICTALTPAGMASGGIPALTVLLTAHHSADVVGDDSPGKLRVARALVVAVLDLPGLGRRGLLSWADLSGADLYRADLTGVDLSGADLSGSDMRGADLSGSDMRGAILTGADLRWADLRGAILTGVDLSGADLTGADLRWADLRGADLSGVDLTGADLTGADLRWADLRGADLSGADLTGADLHGANLTGTDLSQASGADLTGTIR